MKKKIFFLLSLFFIAGTELVNAQSCANYSVSRATGITYTSIAGSTPSYFTWRNLSSNQDDDNRSFAEPIGFDFWYLGVRYTEFSGNLNGTIDFSSSTSDGNNGGTGPYGPNYNNVFTTANMSMLCIAPMYDNLWTAGSGTTPVATSIFYKTTGTAPNRVLIVEWENFDKWNSSTGSVNFQIRLYETTGKIEFIYGTMTTGSAAFTYACGINGSWSSGSPTTADLLTQQTANTTTFNYTAANSLSTLPAANSKLAFTPPIPSATATGLSFTAITQTSMKLHWIDHANNEVGYSIYHSTDSIDFIYAGETTANATSVTINGLYPSTTYYWQVYAVTEGDLGTALSGTQETLIAGQIKSIATGNWHTKSTWDCNCIPTLEDDVTIADGHSVTLNGAGQTNMLTVGEGSSGELIIGNSTISRTLTIDSDLVIHPGAIVTTGSHIATHTLIIDDDIINNGTLNLAPTTNWICNVIFNNDDDSNQVVSGSGNTTNFNGITVNLGSSANKVEITSTHFAAVTNFLTLTNGNFKLSSAATITPFTGNTTIPLYTGFWLNHPVATVSTTGGSITLLGSIKITDGIFNIGDVADNNLLFDNGDLIMEGGAMNIAGRLDKLGVTALTNLAMSAGTLTLATVGSTTAGKAPFQMDEIGSNFTMSGGTIAIRKPGAGNLGFVNTGGTNGTITGGTVQIGDALTPASQTFQINSSIAIPALVVSNGVAVTAQLVTNNLAVINNININAGTLNSNSLNITLGGNWTNNGSFTAGTGTVTFNGTGAQTIGGTSGTAFNNLIINKTSSQVTLITNTTVNAVLSFTSGKISIDNYNLTIGTSGSITGASTNNYAIATGSGTLIQHISNSGSKTFPIGTAIIYIPATVALTASSTTDNFSLRILPSIYSQGETGDVFTSNAVNATWIITEEITGGSDATITLQWPPALELSGFDRSISRLGHYKGGSWDYGSSDIAASGSDPYTVSRAGITSFSPFAVTGNNFTLPVTWLSISGYHDNGNNHIEWATASEQNNRHFAVEYSENGTNFSEAGRVVAAGNSTIERHYSYTHININEPILYYRIMQVDLDGRYSYSKVIKVSSNNTLKGKITLVPNPTSDFANIHINSNKATTMSLQLMNISGRIIYLADKNILPGNNTVKIDLSNQLKGIYLLKLNDSNGSVMVERIIKK